MTPFIITICILAFAGIAIGLLALYVNSRGSDWNVHDYQPTNDKQNNVEIVEEPVKEEQKQEEHTVIDSKQKEDNKINEKASIKKYLWTIFSLIILVFGCLNIARTQSTVTGLTMIIIAIVWFGIMMSKKK